MIKNIFFYFILTISLCNKILASEYFSTSTDLIEEKVTNIITFDGVSECSSTTPQKRKRIENHNNLRKEKNSSLKKRRILSAQSLLMNTTEKEQGIPEEVFISPSICKSSRCKLVKVESLDATWRFFEMAYEQDGISTQWFTGIELKKDKYNIENDIFELLSEKDSIEQALQKQRLLDKFGYYDQPISFRPYDILDKETETLMGRLDYKASDSGFVESSLYFLKAYRGHGYGPEVLAASKENIIAPAIGKPYNVDDTFYDDEYTTKSNIKFKTMSRFKGARAKCDTFYNYGSFSSHIKAGFSATWVDWTPHMIYPPEKNHHYMTLSEVESMKEIMRFFIDIIQGIKKSTPDAQKHSRELLIIIFNEYQELDQEDVLLNNIESLMLTNDINTFMSALNALVSMDQADPEELKEFVKVPSLDIINPSIHPKTISLIKEHKELLEKLKG